MASEKILVGHCDKTGKRFGIELKRNGTNYQAVNFVELSPGEAKGLSSEVSVGAVTSAASLLPCKYCSSRKVSGCSCNRRKKSCKAVGDYDFQCMYCDSMVIEQPKSAQKKIYVTSKQFDDIGEVLTSMGIEYQPYRGELDCDLLFINCGSNDKINPQKLAAFVKNGGCVYASDYACSYIEEAFPGYISHRKEGDAEKITADVVDPELLQIAGGKIEISFDLGAWAVLQKANGKTLLKASAGNRYAQRPIMVSFKYGKGTVFYTSFHNHSQASEKEKMLLQLLLLKQIGSSTDQTIEQVGDLIGLNIASMRSRFRS